MIIQPYLPLAGAAVAIFLWVLTRWYELWQKARQMKSERINLIRAIYAEVDFNMRDLEIFQELSPSVRTLKNGMKKNPKLVPHIVAAKQTRIYNTHIDTIHLFEDDLIRRIVRFYGLLEKISGQVSGLNMESYRTISPGGRLKVIESIYQSSADCTVAGKRLLKMIEERYSTIELKRARRTKPQKGT